MQGGDFGFLKGCPVQGRSIIRGHRLYVLLTQPHVYTLYRHIIVLGHYIL